MPERETARRIARLYGLRPEYIEQYGRVSKLYTDKGHFALKKMNASGGMDFMLRIQELFQRGYHRIMPIYPALDGRYGVLDDRSLYYLMPWLSESEREGRPSREADMFRELARMHTLSVREVEVSPEERQEHFDLTSARWEKEEELLETYVEQCERKVYPSPFELQLLLIYHEITLAQRFAKDKLEQWHEAAKEDRKARTVLIHGKVSPEHFLYNEEGQGFFFNFERAAHASPHHDLLPYLARKLRDFPRRHDDAADSLLVYFRHFAFKEDEKNLFLSYLAYPGHLFRQIEKSIGEGTERSEIKAVRSLLKAYWTMKNTEYVVTRLDEQFRAEKAARENPPSG